MTRATNSPLLYRVIRSVDAAYAASRAIAAELKRLSGRARLTRAADLEQLCREIEAHVQALETQMAAVREDLTGSQRSANVCIAYTRAQKRT